MAAADGTGPGLGSLVSMHFERLRANPGPAAAAACRPSLTARSTHIPPPSRRYYPSITQNSYQTAEVLAALQGVGRNRVVGEFSFLDARGVGELERLPLGETAAALAAGDALSPTWRPNPNVDGTVHESSNDVLVRVRCGREQNLLC